MKQASSFSLCPIISVAPVKGFTDRNQKEYGQYLKKLDNYVHKNTVFSEDQCDLCNYSTTIARFADDRYCFTLLSWFFVFQKIHAE